MANWHNGRSWLLRAVGVWLALGALPAIAVAAGSIAALQGTVEVDRETRTSPLRVGSNLREGDVIRSGASGRAELLLGDDSFVVVAPASEIVIVTQRYVAADERHESLLRVNNGKVRVAVSPNSRRPPSRLEVETATAVATRGAEFIVLHDDRGNASEIVSLLGEVDVAGKLGVVGSSVRVESGYGTVVKKGRFPDVPTKREEDRLVEVLTGFGILGTGGRDGLYVLHPAVMGQLLSTRDIPGAPAAGGPTTGLELGPPREFLAQELSGDIRTNTQPLLEYKRRAPGQPERVGPQPGPTPGGVDVEF